MANRITFLRIPLAMAMLVTAPFSGAFGAVYVCCGLTDIADGFVARRLHQQSAFGAKLDSVADLVFAVCIAVFVMVTIKIPIWLRACMLGIALLRLLSCGMGFYKYHVFAPLHTYANKLTGVLVFMTPVLYRLCGLPFTGIVLCTAAFLSSLEELIITIQAKEWKRDCKSIFLR